MTAANITTEISRPEGGKIVVYLNAAGEPHREEGPAKIWYRDSGEVEREVFYVDGKLHRVNGPAIIEHYENGQVEYEEFYVDGEYHRVDGPAWLRYYEDGQVYREGYFLYGKQHRLDGPARTAYYADGRVKYEEFYLDDVELTSKEFLYKTYIDKLVDPVSREQAIQLAEQVGWKVTVEQLKAAVELTLEEKPAVKLGSAVKTNSIVCKLPGV